MSPQRYENTTVSVCLYVRVCVFTAYTENNTSQLQYDSHFNSCLLFLSNPSPPPFSFCLSPLTDNLMTEQWWHQSNWPIAPRHLQSTTFKIISRRTTNKARWNSSKSLQRFLKSLLLLLFPFPIFYLQLFSTKPQK